MNSPVLSLVAAKDLDRLGAGVGDRQPAQGNKFRRFDLNGVAFGAFLAGAAENYTAWRRVGVGFNNDAVGFGGGSRIVLAFDANGFVIFTAWMRMVCPD